MSDYLAVGGVTAILLYLLTNNLTLAGPSGILTSPAAVTAVPPDTITVGKSEDPQLNLMLYYVSLNPALRNLDLPSRDSGGNLIANPPLALDLHYLISAYGSAQLTPEILLGWAMKVFHDNPVVPKTVIADALTQLAGGSSAEAKLVATSTLAGQFEHIRITPQTLTTEEIYRLWPAFGAPYRPSTAYQVSVVVIQDTAAMPSGPPVRKRKVLALPLQTPVISGISPSTPTAGDLLTITGSSLLGQAPSDTVLSFDGAAAVHADLVQGNYLQVTLPASLLAGTRTVRVQRMVTFEGETDARPGFTSSPAPFQLVPVITPPVPAATLGGPLKLTISPPVGRAQQATVYIGDYAISVPPRPATAPATDASLTFTVPAGAPPAGPGAGTFPIRVEIDGASSLLTPQPGGQWTPQVVVS